jgi:hypothetical protein
MHVRLLTFNRRDLACQVRKSQGHVGRHHSRARKQANKSQQTFFFWQPQSFPFLLLKGNFKYTRRPESNSLANQPGIHIILAKQEKSASNSLANQLGKNRNLAKLTSPRAYTRARTVVAIVVSF